MTVPYDDESLNMRNKNNILSERFQENESILTQYPSQLHCLKTTVPQNITSKNNLGDKHKPTRNSLRRSRMIVMNRTEKIPTKYLPFIIKRYWLMKSLKISIIIFGMIMSTLSALLVIWSPNLRILDYPYWSAIPVFCSGVVGCVFLGFCPRPYPGRKLGPHYHIAKFISILTTTLAILLTLIVFTLGSFHMAFIQKAHCMPYDYLNKTCLCSAGEIEKQQYHYEDLTCEEINTILIGVIAAINFLAVPVIFLESIYLYAHWISTKKYTYTMVPLNDFSANIEK